jgi:PAS domain S-box-containing protein
MRRTLEATARKTAILHLNRAFRIIQGNEAMAKLTGHSVEQLKKLNIRDTWDPDEAKFLERNMATASVGVPSRYRRGLRRADRTYILVDESLRHLPTGGYRIVLCRAPRHAR